MPPGLTQELALEIGGIPVADAEALSREFATPQNEPDFDILHSAKVTDVNSQRRNGNWPGWQLAR